MKKILYQGKKTQQIILICPLCLISFGVDKGSALTFILRTSKKNSFKYLPHVLVLLFVTHIDWQGSPPFSLFLSSSLRTAGALVWN